MNKSEFNEIIKGQRLLADKEYSDIIRISRSYPYFQSAYVVLLNALYRNDDIEFIEKLKETSIYIADREALYNLLNSGLWSSTRTDGSVHDHVDNTEVQIAPVQKEQNISNRDEIVIKKDEEESKGAFEPVTGRTREELVEEIESRLAEISGDEDMLQLDDNNELENIEEDADYKEDALLGIGNEDELLDLAEEDQDGMKLEEDEDKADDIIVSEEENIEFIDDDDLVEKFIKTNPRIEPRRDDHDEESVDISISSTEESSSLVSETLAKIYISQGYYTKAINIYERLSLKYPEKSSYFATQIEKIEDIIDKI